MATQPVWMIAAKTADQSNIVAAGREFRVVSGWPCTTLAERGRVDGGSGMEIEGTDSQVYTR